MFTEWYTAYVIMRAPYSCGIVMYLETSCSSSESISPHVMFFASMDAQSSQKQTTRTPNLQLFLSCVSVVVLCHTVHLVSVMDSKQILFLTDIKSAILISVLKYSGYSFTQ